MPTMIAKMVKNEPSLHLINTEIEYPVTVSRKKLAYGLNLIGYNHLFLSGVSLF